MVSRFEPYCSFFCISVSVVYKPWFLKKPWFHRRETMVCRRNHGFSSRLASFCVLWFDWFIRKNSFIIPEFLPHLSPFLYWFSTQRIAKLRALIFYAKKRKVALRIANRDKTRGKKPWKIWSKKTLLIGAWSYCLLNPDFGDLCHTLSFVNMCACFLNSLCTYNFM